MRPLTPTQSKETGTWLALTGTPASSGTVTGRAKVVASVSDLKKISSNVVLIVGEADSRLLAMCPTVTGIVSERGGALCALGNQARALGIPFVAGVPDAKRIIPEGTAITLEGATGRITVRYM